MKAGNGFCHRGIPYGILFNGIPLGTEDTEKSRIRMRLRLRIKYRIQNIVGRIQETGINRRPACPLRRDEASGEAGTLRTQRR